MAFKLPFTKDKIVSKVGGLVRLPFIKKSPGPISDSTVNYTNTDLTTLRNQASQKEVIKAMLTNSPDASMAMASKARFAITDQYYVMAYSIDGKFDAAATVTAQALVNRLDKMRPAYDAYYFPNDFRSLSERALRQLQICGSFGAELIIAKGNIPSHINIFSTRALKYEQKGGRAIPKITVEGEDYYLDSPLIIIEDLDQDVETPYSTSPLTAATQSILADFEFVNDLRRAFSKASLPRPVAKIMSEKFLESLPMDVRADKKKLSEAMTEAIAAIREEMNGLRPEDALVYFDTVEVDHLSAGNISAHESVREHKELLNAKVASGLRTLPSILGRGESSTAASTEAMAYLRAVEGEQEKLNHMFSSLLTVGTRLLGHDCYVEFFYSDPELRPKSELESFRVTRQSRVLEQLSLGLISDEEASILLTGALPSGDYKPLSGTMFRGGVAAGAENPYSNTSVTGEGVNDTKSGKDQKPKDQKPSSNKTTGR